MSFRLQEKIMRKHYIVIKRKHTLGYVTVNDFHLLEERYRNWQSTIQSTSRHKLNLDTTNFSWGRAQSSFPKTLFLPLALNSLVALNFFLYRTPAKREVSMMWE